MAELSFPWPDTTTPGPQVGDGRPYTNAEWRKFWRLVFSRGYPDEYGVLPLHSSGVLDTLEVSSDDDNEVTVATGAAVVAGFAYMNDASLDLTVASAPAGQTRKDYVVLRVDWSGGDQYTVRADALEGSSGSYPSLTQTDATTWEIALAGYTVNDAGEISGIEDLRDYTRMATMVDTDMLADDAITTAKIADDAVDTDQIAAGAVDTDQLAADSVTADKIATGAVGSSEIASGAVDTAELANTSVTLAKMDNDSVGTLKIVDEAVTNAKLDPDCKRIKGEIIMWSGTLGGSDGDRPIDPDSSTAIEEWHVCNGDTVNGVATPNLEDKFIVGAGNSYALAATGGAASHTHAAGTLALSGPTVVDYMTAGGNEVADTSHAHTVSGSTASGSTLPPYYALLFLCYVGS